MKKLRVFKISLYHLLWYILTLCSLWDITISVERFIVLHLLLVCPRGAATFIQIISSIFVAINILKFDILEFKRQICNPIVALTFIEKTHF